jgi:hypothetical protein
MSNMKEIADVLSTANGPKSVSLLAREAFLQKREEIWKNIQESKFPLTYTSSEGRKFFGAPRRHAIRCDFLIASKIALGSKYRTDRIADLAQRDFLFYVLRERERYPERTGKKFFCCPKCTSKLYECVSLNLFRYIDNAKWKAEIESGNTKS